jgi:glycosyltransferase involved in cell wall biosynthesis
MLSIITPNLNNGKYLEDNIKSIMLLDIPFEHIIIDGGSNDNSIDIISKYPHVKLLNQTEKTGMYGAIHQGFMESSGDLITWVNSDDRIIKDGFENMYSEATKSNIDFIYSDGKYFFTKDNHTEFGKGRRFGKFFLKHGCIPAVQPSIIFSKKIYDLVGGLQYNKFKICGDLDLFVRIANKHEAKFKYIPVSSTVFMKRGDSLGDLNNDLYLKEMRENKLPTPNLLVRTLFFICKYI